jgi:hypothetical protein
MCSLSNFQNPHPYFPTSCPIPIPSRRFSHIHIDLVGPLPSSQGHTHILTVMDRTTRWAEAVPLPSTSAPPVPKPSVPPGSLVLAFLTRSPPTVDPNLFPPSGGTFPHFSTFPTSPQQLSILNQMASLNVSTADSRPHSEPAVPLQIGSPIYHGSSFPIGQPLMTLPTCPRLKLSMECPWCFLGNFRFSLRTIHPNSS